jgi:hypothetical protein
VATTPVTVSAPVLEVAFRVGFTVVVTVFDGGCVDRLPAGLLPERRKDRPQSADPVKEPSNKLAAPTEISSGWRPSRAVISLADTFHRRPHLDTRPPLGAFSTALMRRHRSAGNRPAGNTAPMAADAANGDG